jgi:3-methyladenine DNA glycosylase Mpg
MLEEYYRQEFAEEHKQLEKSFFQCDAVTLARRLLGKFLYTTQCVILRITEVNN